MKIETELKMGPDIQKALLLAKRQLSELVCTAVNLKGTPFTLPEIQTLMDGITFDDHEVSDQVNG